MKNLTLIMICLICLSIKGYSQSTGKKILSRMEFGIKGGANYSDFTDANFSTDPLVGYHGGLTVAYRFTDNLMVQQEFMYSTMGAKILSGALGAQDLKLSYMTIPILLKYRTNFGLYVEGGGQVAFKIDEEVANFNGTDFAKKMDFGAIGGLGFQSKIGLGIGARYIYGFEKVQENNTPALGNEFKNNSIQASLFFVF